MDEIKQPFEFTANGTTIHDVDTGQQTIQLVEQRRFVSGPIIRSDINHANGLRYAPPSRLPGLTSPESG